MAVHAEFAAWLLPPEARNEWLTLAAVLAESGPVSCETSDPAAWWPDRKGLNSPETLAAVSGCRRCPAQDACLAYAVAADEPEGIWGGTLPAERRAVRPLAA